MPPPTEATSENRKTIPQGDPSALEGLKFLFTGTLDLLDRNTAKKTVEQHGGSIISNLEKTDYIVLGANCGPKKLETIRAKNLTTITEEGFFQLLEGKQPTTETAKDLAKTSTKPMPSKPAAKGKTEAPKKEKASEKPIAKPSTKTKTASSAGTAKSGGDERKKEIKGKTNALEGIKLLFTGTMETMDRVTSKKTAEAHGATVITRLADTDLIVLGTRAGPKKLQEIEDKGLRTCTEEEFIAMVKDGASDAEEGEDQDEEEEEAEQKPTVGKKRGATSTGRGKGKKAKTAT